MNEKTKVIINRLQFYIDKSTDNILFIFDTQESLNRHKQSLMTAIKEGLLSNNFFDNTILVSISELTSTNKLDGLRFCRYHFVID